MPSIHDGNIFPAGLSEARFWSRPNWGIYTSQFKYFRSIFSFFQLTTAHDRNRVRCAGIRHPGVEPDTIHRCLQNIGLRLELLLGRLQNKSLKTHSQVLCHPLLCFLLSDNLTDKKLRGFQIDWFCWTKYKTCRKTVIFEISVIRSCKTELPSW